MGLFGGEVGLGAEVEAIAAGEKGDRPKSPLGRGDFEINFHFHSLHNTPDIFRA